MNTNSQDARLRERRATWGWSCVATLLCAGMVAAAPMPAAAQLYDGLKAAGLLNDDFCWKKNESRGVGVPHSTCKPGTQAPPGSLYCYGSCAPGFTYDGATACWTTCPAGYSTVLAECVPNQEWVTRTRLPCPAGYTDRGTYCDRAPSKRPKACGCWHMSAISPAQSPTVCGSDQNLEPGTTRCYNNCPAGYTRKGLYCYEECGAGYIDDGFSCHKEQPITIQRPVGDCPPDYVTELWTCRRDPDSYNKGTWGWNGCREGYRSDSGYYCYRDANVFSRQKLPCPAGYEFPPGTSAETALTCQSSQHIKPKRSQEAGYNEAGCAAGLTKSAGLCYADLGGQSICGNDACNPGERPDSCDCWIDAHTMQKQSSPCPAGYDEWSPDFCKAPRIRKEMRSLEPEFKVCAPGQEEQGSACYTPCKPKWSGAGTTCLMDCPNEYYPDNCGLACAPKGQCPQTIAGLITMSLEVVVNLAFTVVSSLTGGSATAAMTSAKLATKVAAQTLAKTAIKGSIKGALKSLLKTFLTKGITQGLKVLKGAIKSGIRYGMRKVLGEKLFTLATRGIGGKIAEIAKGYVQSSIKGAVKQGILAELKPKVGEMIAALGGKLNAKQIADLKARFTGEEPFDPTMLDPTGIVGMAMAFDKPLCSKAVEDKRIMEPIEDALKTISALESPATEDEMTSSMNEAVESVPGTAADLLATALTGSTDARDYIIPLYKMGGTMAGTAAGENGFVQDRLRDQGRWVVAVEIDPRQNSGKYKLIVSKIEPTGDLARDQRSGALIKDVVLKAGEKKTVDVGAGALFVRLQGRMVEPTPWLEMVGGQEGESAGGTDPTLVQQATEEALKAAAEAAAAAERTRLATLAAAAAAAAQAAAQRAAEEAAKRASSFAALKAASDKLTGPVSLANWARLSADCTTAQYAARAAGVSENDIALAPCLSSRPGGSSGGSLGATTGNWFRYSLPVPIDLGG